LDAGTGGETIGSGATAIMDATRLQNLQSCLGSAGPAAILRGMTSRRRLLEAGVAGALAAGVGAPWSIRHARAGDEERFALGVASGCPRADGVVLWTRLTGAALPAAIEVRWEVADDERFARIVAQGTETALADEAHSVHAEVGGLRSDHWYWYRFSALGARSAAGRTRTAPAADAPSTLRLAIASCQRFDHGHYAAWRHAAADELDLVLFLGDYIYEYPSPPGALRRHTGGFAVSLDDYRERYAQYKGDAALQTAHAAAPWLVIWDDHEVDNDYAGLVPQLPLQPAWPFVSSEAAFAARRAAAYRAWWEHMPVPRAMKPLGPDARIHQRLDWGRLARIHTLDDRQHRSAQACPPPGRGGANTVDSAACTELDDPRRTLLGVEQERWLAEGWDRERPWNLVAQQTLMARFAWSDPATGPAKIWTDGWDGYPHARRRLLQGARASGVRNLVTFGGDVHTHYVADLKLDYGDPTAPVIGSEFVTTSISSRSMPQPRLDAALPFNPHVHFGRSDRRGYMRFELDPRALTASVRVLDDATDAHSRSGEAARFVVEAGRPGPQRA